jgi:uncharacterized protein (TIGR02145 family)
MKNSSRNLVFKQSAYMQFTKIISIVLFFEVGLIRVQAQTVTDINGNVYNTVIIGTQVWMAENLKTTRYNDNTSIPPITDNIAWVNLVTPGYSWYNNDEATYKDTYGALYNWYSVDVSSNGGKNVCPTGWHVPTVMEWMTLTDYLGGEDVAGGKLKESGTTHWLSPNTGATNETGFTALPGGSRHYAAGSFSTITNYGEYWSTSKNNSSRWYCHMNYGFSYAMLDYNSPKFGFSIRCLRDELATLVTNPLASTITIEIYPNPVSGVLNIKYKDENFETVSILNSQGLLLTKEKAIMNKQQIDFSKYASGLYILEFVKTSGEISRVKVVNN